MKSFEIIQLLTKSLVPVENCGTAVFDTSDLSELTRLFGKNFSWSGYMFEGKVFYAYNRQTDDWFIEDADLIGSNLEDKDERILVFKVGA